MLFSEAASHALAQLCSNHPALPPAERLAKVRQCISDGADVTTRERNNAAPLYGRFLREDTEECADCFAACLSCPQPLDFTAKCYNDRSIIHEILCQPDRRRCEAMLRTLVSRIERHPEDTIDWSLEGPLDGYTALEYHSSGDAIVFSAWKGRLSLYWSVVKNVPYYADQTTAIPVEIGVFPFDLAAFPAEDKWVINCVKGELTYDDALYRLRWFDGTGFPEKEMLQHCVDAGGSVGYTVFGDEYTILNAFLARGDVDRFRICLSSPLAIDFTAMDGEAEFTVMMLGMYGSLEVMSEMLQAVLERLRHGSEHYNPGDVIDWGQENSSGQSFRSGAILSGRWSAFWPYVKDVAYFAQRPELAPNPEQDEER